MLMGGNTAIGKCREALGLSHAHKDEFLLVLEQTRAQILTFAICRGASSTQRTTRTVTVQVFLLVKIDLFLKSLLTLQRGVTGTARMLHALTHSSISRQVREQM